MRSLLAAYEAHLRLQARQPAVQRLGAFQRMYAPWGLGAFFVAVSLRSFGAPLWLFVPLVGLLLVGGGWATFRFNKYGSEFDHTPPAALWVDTEDGKELVAAIGRVSLSSLAGLTPQTRLREDLRLTSSDLFELFTILKGPDVDGTVLERCMETALTIEDLLQGMEKSKADGDSRLVPNVR